MNLSSQTNRTALLNDMERALEEVAKKHGVKFDWSAGLRYELDGGSFTFRKFDVKRNDNSVSVDDVARKEFERKASWYDMKPSDLGKIITLTGKRGKKISVRVDGFAPRSRSGKIVVTDINDNTKYHCDHDVVRAKIDAAGVQA